MKTLNAQRYGASIAVTLLLSCVCALTFGCDALSGALPGAGGSGGDDPAGAPQPAPGPGSSNLAPTAAAGDDLIVKLGGVVVLDGGASFDADGEIVAYHWDLGEGGTAEGAVVEHIFDEAGVYEVVLTVIDDEGAEGTDRVIVTVEAPRTFALTIIVEPPGAGTVLLDPPGGIYSDGDIISIDVEPSPGFVFAGLTGDVEAQVAPVEVLMDADKRVTVVLSPIEVLLDVSVDPPNGGEVTLDPPGGVYAFGTTVHIEAIASSGFSFASFLAEGGALISTSAILELVLEENRSLVAQFELTDAPPPATFTLSVEVVPAGGGAVTLDPPGGGYEAGTVVNLTAAAASGYAFSHFAGDASGSDPVATVTMDGDKSVTAEFNWSPAIGNPGNLLVTGFLGKNVTEFDRLDGHSLGELVTAEDSGLTFAGGIDIGPDGDVFVVDIGVLTNTRVLRYDPMTGEPLGTFVEGPGAVGFFTIRFGPGGNLFVGNNEADAIEEYDGATGSFVRTFVEPGSGGLDGPLGMRFGPNGNLFVVSKDSDSILEYDGATGEFVGTVADLSTYGFSIPVDLDFGSDNALYVTTSGDESVARIDPATGVVSAFVAAGSGGLDAPSGLGFHPDSGNLLVVSQGTNSVLEYDGKTGAFASVFAEGLEGDNLFLMAFRPR